MDFPTVLQGLLEWRHWSLRELSARSYINQTTLSRWKNKNQAPSNSLLLTLAWAFGLNRAQAELLIVAVEATQSQASDEAAAKLTASLHEVPDRESVGPALRQNAGTTRVIRGAEAIVGEAFELIREARHRAADPELETPIEILVTWQAEGDIFDIVPDRRSEWVLELREALAAGCEVRHVVRQEPNGTPPSTLVKSIVALLGPHGNYRPYLLPRDRSVSPPYELLVVPDVGTVVFLSTESLRRVDAAIFSSSPEYAKVYAQHLTSIQSRGAQVIIPHRHMDSEEYSAALARAELAASERCLVIEGLSQVTVPPDVHRNRARDIARPPLVQDEIDRSEARHDQFLKRITNHRCIDVCSERAIRAWLASGNYSPDDILTRHGARPETPEEIEDHCEQLIEMIDLTNQRGYQYELWLVAEEALHEVFQLYYMVNNNDSVFMLIPDGDTVVERGLAIQNSALASAFYEHTMTEIGHHAHVTTDQSVVVGFLRTELEKAKVQRQQHLTTH